MPLGEAAAAASAPALVRARAMAAIAAVRLPLHRGVSAGGTAAIGAYGASWGTVSCTSDRGCSGTGTVRWGIGVVRVGAVGGTVNPGGGDAGGSAVTPTGCGCWL
jgi:hypothetical protein